MHGSFHGRGRRLFVLLVPLALAGVTVPASPVAAEEAKLEAAEVAEKLKTIQTIAGDVAGAGAHQKKAALIAEGISPIWARIEDTIKANDKASYEALEAAIESLEKAAEAGDGTKAGGAAAAFASAVDSYVAKVTATSTERTASASDPAPAERRAAADPATGGAPASRAAEAPDATLARTGPLSGALAAWGGAAFALGGIGVMAGARRRTSAA